MLTRTRRAAAAAGRALGGLRRACQSAAIVQNEDGVLEVPDFPIVPFIMGDGSGTDLWQATRHVLDEAVRKAYSGQREISWLEVVAGANALQQGLPWLPRETVEAFRHYRIGMKGPLQLPQEGASITISLRQALDLYCNVRPIWYLQGVPSPLKRPELVNVTVFREATEDVYGGLEFAAGTVQAASLHDFLAAKGMNTQPFGSGSTSFAIKTISREGAERLVEAAIQFGLAHNKRNVVLIHKGTIMKYTEGLFKEVAYQVATERYREHCVTERESFILGNYERGLTDPHENAKELDPGFEFMSEKRLQEVEEEVRRVLDTIWETHGDGKWKTKLLIRDVIISTALQQVMMRPSEFDVLVAPNLYGAIISSWLLAQVGGAGMSPSGSYNFETGHAVFEASSGPAPRYAGLDRANPSGQLLAGSMMLQQLGWTEAAAMVAQAVQKTILSKAVPYDLKLLHKEAPRALPCSEFGRAVVDNMEAPDLA